MKRPRQSPRAIWVVEMLCGNRWDPTVGVGLCREDGRRQLAEWRSQNPHDGFRLVKYARAGEKRRGG